MIYIDRTITVEQGSSRMDEPVILYRGDHDVSVRFKIINASVKFGSDFNMIEYDNTPHAQLIILSPTKEAIFSDILSCEEGVAEFTIPQELLDDLNEVGKYSFQIRLYDYDQGSRITIPQVKNGIVVREPIISENDNV